MLDKQLIPFAVDGIIIKVMGRVAFWIKALGSESEGSRFEPH